MTIKNMFRIFSVIAILAMGMLFVTQTSIVSAAADTRGGPGGRGGNGQGISQPGTGSALSPLSTAEATALQEAILEEYGAFNLYHSAIVQVGNVYPFSQIVRAEQQHINALMRQADTYGVTVPANPGLATQPAYNTLAQACQAGVDAEIADAALLSPIINDQISRHNICET
jgi:hypothetical protein